MIERPPTIDASQTISRSSSRKELLLAFFGRRRESIRFGACRLLSCSLAGPRADLRSHDLPILAFEDLLQSPLEQLAIGRGHLQAKSIVVSWHYLAGNLKRRRRGIAGKQIAGAIPYDPTRVHHTHSGSRRTQRSPAWRTGIRMLISSAPGHGSRIGSLARGRPISLRSEFDRS